MEAAKRLLPQRELSAVRLTEDNSLFCGFLLPQGKGISSTIRSAKGSPPSAEGGEGWRRSRHKLLFRACWARPKDGARLAALRSPFGNLRPPSSCNCSISNVGRSRRLCQPP